MGEYDWYSRKTWTKADQADFFARLNRSRTSYNKAQYLWVQARELHDVGLTKEAVTLLDLMLAEYPERFFLPHVYQLKAECISELGDTKQALECYRCCLDVERKFPNNLTESYYDFGKLVAENKMVEYYDEALALLK